MPHFFITGTDTGVGKTFFTCWLIRAWRARGFKAAGLKPIASGDREDAELIRAASGDALALDEINPVHFRAAAAPLVAAREEKRAIDFAELNRGVRKKMEAWPHLAIEGVGGWRVPLAEDYDVRDWARELALPVVVVARAGLGTLNHTRLTVDSIHGAGLTCAGLVVNPGPEASPDLDLVRRTNLELLGRLTLLPVLDFQGGVEAAGEIPVWLGGK